jgi:IS605 OrfB family transposase
MRLTVTVKVEPAERVLSRDLESETVSLWTVAGRRRMPFECRDGQRTRLERQQGESDLIYHRQAFSLATTSNVDVPEPPAVDDYLGVDLGVANLASDSDGRRYSASEVTNVRWRNRKLRARLEAKQSRSAKGRLKKLAGRESRFARRVNHCTSNEIVAPAKGTGGGIRREELKGIRTRAKVRHGERGVLHYWAFSQLRQMIAYKAALAGVLVELVDPHNTSRTCSKCGHCEKGNGGNQSEFRCRSCGHQAHADINAAENIRQGRCKEAERDVVENRLSHTLQAAFSRSHKPSPLGQDGLLFPLQ